MEEKKSSSKRDGVAKWLKIMAIVVLVFATIYVIVLRYQNPDFNTGLLVTFIIIFVAGAVGILFGSRILKMIRGNGKKEAFSLPAPVTIDYCKEMVEMDLAGKNYADRIGKVEEEGIILVGKEIKSSIYVHVCRGKREPATTYVHLINMHYPETKKTRLINPSKVKIDQYTNYLAVDPNDVPNSEVTTEVRDPISGEFKRETQRTFYNRTGIESPKELE